jgi:Family of unknown function (DUF6188)
MVDRRVSRLSKRFEQHGGGLVIHLDGWELNRCCLDYQVSLEFVDFRDEDREGTFLVVIGTPFLIHAADGAPRRADPGDLPNTIAPVLGFLRQRLVGASVDNAGALHLRFGDVAEIEVPPHPDFEAWQIQGPGLFAVSPPGGGEPVLFREARPATAADLDTPAR